MKYKLKNFIIITGSEEQVQKVYKMNNEEFNNIGWGGGKIQDYDKNWYWWVDEYGKLSGVSGHGEPEYTMERLNKPIILFKTFKNGLKNKN